MDPSLASPMLGERIPAAGALLLGLLVAASGCVGTPPKPHETMIHPDPTLTFGSETCAIDGFVLDDEYLALGNATVRITGPGEPREATSRGNGYFAFSDLEPGLYDASAALEGYEGDFETVACTEGTAKEITLLLVELPPANQPFHLTYTKGGTIGCAVGLVAGFQTTDLCHTATISPDTSSTVSIPINTEPITGAVFELVWNPSTGGFGAPCLTLQYPKPTEAEAAYGTDDDLNADGGSVSGLTPVNVTITSTTGEKLYVVSPGGEHFFTVRPGAPSMADFTADPAGACMGKLVMQQTFTIYATYFYNGDPIPVGFTANE